MSFKAHVPWWAKIAAKVILSRIPAGYKFWHRMNLFVHGDMVNPDYALRVVRWHVKQIGRPDLRDLTVLELGPGDSLGTAVIAKALGAHRIILIDAGAFATTEPARYIALADHLRRNGLYPPDLSGCDTLEEVLRRCNASYLSNGVKSLESLASDSVDVVFSHAVLEHLRKRDVLSTFKELVRVTKADGVGSHKVDLADHLDGRLNNLRFSERMWEAEWIASSGFYTNRIRYGEMCRMLTLSGFDVQVLATDTFSRLPTSRAKLSEVYASLPDADLLVRGFHVLVRCDAAKRGESVREHI